MSDMNNQAFLYGNVGSDPVVTYLENGNPVANFSLATKETWKDKKTGEWKDKTTWHDITCWGEIAKAIERKVVKGTSMTIQGKICNDVWEDKEGKKHKQTFIQLDKYIIHPQAPKRG